MRTYKLSNFLKLVFIVVGILVFSLVNYLFIRPLFPNYDKFFRDIDHLFAAFGCSLVYTYILSKISGYNKNGKLYNTLIKTALAGCMVYIIGSINWEYKNYLAYYYLQIDQYLFDILGCILVFILCSKNRFKLAEIFSWLSRQKFSPRRTHWKCSFPILISQFLRWSNCCIRQNLRHL